MKQQRRRTIRLVMETLRGRMILEHQCAHHNLCDLTDLLDAARDWSGSNRTSIVSLHTGTAPKEPNLR